MSDYQLPSGQLWWRADYVDDTGNQSVILFTYEGEREQTWYNAYQKAQIMLREMRICALPKVSLYA